jgi:flagellar M-ring protein FliF
MADPTTEESKGLIAQLARSGRMRIAAALVVVALVGGGLGVIMLRGDSGGKKLLFSGLDLEEAGEISNKLDTAGIPYSLEGGGSAVFVDGEKVEKARMMLSEQGLPTRGSVGWEIFDKSDALGETQFVLNIKKVRAMEGELERTIGSYDMVQSARVHLSIPDRPLFQQNSEKPKASVVLKMTGKMMPQEKVRAIRNLVASQVPGLDIGAVTISSTDGRLLAAASDSDDPGGLGGGASVDERRAAMEDSYRKKVLDVIENIAGPGAAKVTVSLEADFNKVTQSSESYKPPSPTMCRRALNRPQRRSPRASPTPAAQSPPSTMRSTRRFARKSSRAARSSASRSLSPSTTSACRAPKASRPRGNHVPRKRSTASQHW